MSVSLFADTHGSTVWVGVRFFAMKISIVSSGGADIPLLNQVRH